ncbi:exocyst complex subunit [Scheffersomyces coipomensis]|uniref:exocyst complex subunit n=1 Tax=Scheffersomyces coipomensis TaxID=1788519 RepID=UPI00315C8815
MSDIALSRIAHLLKVEDDLVKIPELRQQFIREKASIDVKLSSTTQQQIDSLMTNISKLNDASSRINSIKGNITRINQIYDESITNIKDYATIKKMSSVNQYLNQVENLYQDIRSYSNILAKLNKKIEAEYQQLNEDLSYPLPNIISIHFEYNRVRNFSDYLETFSNQLSDDLKAFVNKVIKMTKTTIRLFDELLKEMIISLTEAVKDDNVQLVYKLVKIIEFEANEDLKFTLMENLGINQGNGDFKTIDYVNFRGSKRNYKKFFYIKLEECLDDTFNDCIKHYSSDPMQVYEGGLDWLEDELRFVFQRLNPMLPSNWDVDSFFQNVYYNRLHKYTMDVINTDPPAEDLMKILNYDTYYGKFLVALQNLDTDDDKSKRKSVIKKEQKSIIGEELKNSVLEDYLKVITSKSDEWTDNLIKMESENFVQRSIPPDTYHYSQQIEDEDVNDQLITVDITSDVYVLPDFNSALTMLKGQADVAADSGYSKILAGVLENFSKCYIKRIINFQKLIEDEIEKYMSIYSNEGCLIKESKAKRLFRSGKSNTSKTPQDFENMTPEELAQISQPALIEYLAALGNTFEINTDRLSDKFLPEYQEKVHSAYQNRLIQAIEETNNPSTELNAQILRAIVDIIVNDLYPELSKLFTKSWYEDGQNLTSDQTTGAARIAETIAEYMGELRSYTTYDIYSLTFNILLDSFISDYIRIGYENILHGDGKKIDPKAVKKYKSFSEGINRDVTLIYGKLQPLFTRKDTAYLMSLQAIELLGDLGMCDEPMTIIPQIWEHDILPLFYYCPIEYVRGLCLCRKDMDKRQVNQLCEQLEIIQKDYQSKVEPPSMPIATLNDFTFKD